MESIYTCKEVAQRYKVTQKTVNKWIREKKLCAIGLSSRDYRIREEDLVKFETVRTTIK